MDDGVGTIFEGAIDVISIESLNEAVDCLQIRLNAQPTHALQGSMPVFQILLRQSEENGYPGSSDRGVDESRHSWYVVSTLSNSPFKASRGR